MSRGLSAAACSVAKSRVGAMPTQPATPLVGLRIPGRPHPAAEPLTDSNGQFVECA